MRHACTPLPTGGIVDKPSVADPAIRGDGVHADRIAATHPMGRLGGAEEVAQAVVWLCSPTSSCTTGHVLAVDSGYRVT